METIASSLSVSPNFSGLRSSISNLQAASKALDAEKAEAEKKFKDALDKLPKKTDRCQSQYLPEWLKKIIRAIRRHVKHAPLEELFKAAKRVQSVNSKLRVFERGFISEEGISEREWYKHLVVAPGKWLGEFTVPYLWGLAADVGVVQDMARLRFPRSRRR